MNPALSRTVIWAAVASLWAIVGGLVALYALAPAANKPDIAPLFATIGAGLIAGVPALAAWLKGKQNAQTISEHGQTLQKIDAQTNGQLDARITTAVQSAMESRPEVFTHAAMAGALHSLLAPHLPAAVPPPASTPTPEGPTG